MPLGENRGIDFGHDVTETKLEEKSDSEAEQTESTEDDKETGVTETSVEPSEETTEVTPEEDSEEAPEENAAEGGALNAVADTESTISVEYKNADEQGEDGKDVAGKESDAEVVFLGGCVSSDKKLAEGRDLRFKVEPAAGRVVTKVERQIGEATSGTEIAADSNGVYTVGKASFVENEKAVNGKIIVTTKAVKYTVSFAKDDNGLENSYTIYAVETKDNAEVLSEVTGGVEVKYSDSKKFAVEVKTPSNKLTGLSLNGDSITTTAAELNKKDDEAETPKTKCFTFTVDPSKAEELKDVTTDTAAVVKVKVVAKAKLTVAFDANENSSVVASATNTTDTYINYTDEKFGTDSTFVEDNDTNLTKSLAFKVIPNSNYKITDVTAKATTDANTEGTAVTVTKGTAAADGSVECTIALSQVKGFSVDTELTISIAADLDTTKDAVHVINFKSAAGSSLERVDITHGAADTALKDDSLTVTDDTYSIKVAPKDGYELAKGTKTEGSEKNDDKYVVTVVENRVYAGTTTPKAITTEVEAVDSEGAAKAIPLKLKDDDNLYDGGDAEGAEPKAYVVKTVDITINATVKKNDGEKLVHFDDQLGAGYKITTEGVIQDEEAEDKVMKDSWVIPASVDVLTFTVTSAKEPAVTVGGADVEGTLADGVYTYSYPAQALNGSETTEILIEDQSVAENKEVKVKVVPDDVTVNYNDPKVPVNFGDDEADADGYYTIDAAAKEGKEIELIFTPKPGVTIDKVSYAMGETKGNKTPDRHGVVSLSLIVTDNVIVDVESKSDYRVKLTCGTDEEGQSKELAQDGDAYVADYTDTNIGIALTKAGKPYGGNLYDVVVKDGAKTAATEATVSGSTATIAKIADSEYGKDLTIEVYIDKSTKYTTTLKTNAVSEEVTVNRVVNGKNTKVAEDATVEIMPDAEMAFTVTPAKGASLSDLNVEILAKDGAALTTETSPIAEWNFTDGALTVTTKPGAAKDTEVLVSVYNTHAEPKDGKNVPLKGGKFVLKLTDPLVKTAEISKVNAVAGSATNRAVRLNVSVDFKNKKNLPVKPIQGDLYYKVDFTAPTGAPEGVTVIPATTKYVKVDDYANTAKTIELALVTANTEDKDAVIADIAETISTTAKVTLVQSLSTTNLQTAETIADTDYVAGPAAAKDTALSTKKPVYETKLSVKNVNGATVTTGQSNVKVATPVFGKNTSYDSITVQFVDTKTGVLKGDSYIGFTTRVDTDNSILVSADESVRVNGSNKNAIKTLGVKVTAAGPDDSYKASAVVKLKVKQGIYSVAKDESKAKLPVTIFKDPKKAASVKITPLLNEGSKDYKPAKSSVTWTIDRASGNTSTYAAAALTGKKPLVSVKNGTVSIAKGYQVQTAEADNMFTVTIKANDFADNTKSASYTFEITDQKNAIGELVVCANGEETDPASLTAEDFSTKSLYVVANDAKGNSLPVTYKSSNAKALAVNAATGALAFYKPADKIKITATTVDGSKASKSVTINVKPYKQVGLQIEGEDITSGLDETEIHYSGGSNEKYTLTPYYAAGNDWTKIEATGYKNLKITVKGGKFIADSRWAKNQISYMGTAVVVTDKSGKATITITDTANKDKKTNHKDYFIINDNPTAVKAPSIKLYDPKKVTAGTMSITWQVKDGKNDNFAGSYVKLTPDFTVTASNYADTIVEDQGTVLKINENGRFTLDTSAPVDWNDDGEVDYWSSKLNTGASYKMVATVGTMVGGEFVASAKDVKLNFSTPKVKINTKLTVKGSYTLDAKSASYAVIDVKSDYNYEISNAMNVMKKVQGKNDHTNEFTKYFEVQPLTYVDDYYGIERVYAYTIGLKQGLSAEQIEYITSKEGKDDCTGYITVSNGYYTKDVQVKISFKANKYSLTGATIFSNGAANTPVTATVHLMNGKNLDYVALAWVDATDDGRFIAAGNDWATISGGDIILKSKTEAIAPGKYDVKLIVVPQSSSYVQWDSGSKKWIVAKDKVGVDGKDLTDAELVAKAGIPVTAKIEVKAVDTKSIAKVKSLNVTLNSNDYVQATSAASGYYYVDVPYSIAIGGSDIAAEAGSVKVNLTNKAGENQNEVTVAANTKEELVKASRVIVKDDHNNDIPVIRLQVSKNALVTLSGMAKADKPITGYGKKLKVPVEIKYTNGITTTDTLNFNITMPKKAPADFEGVQKIIADNQAVIEKIQTRLLKLAAEDELTALYDDVYAKVNSLVPADTDVSVIYSDLLTKKDLNDGEDVEQAEADTALSDTDYDDIMEAGKAKITLTLKDLTKASANTKDVSFTYTLGMNAKGSDLNDAVSIIEGLSLTYNNDTTAASLLAEIKAADAVKPYLDARKAHLSLKVSSYTRIAATTKKEGTFTAKIQVKDLATGASKTADVGIDDNIEKLSNLTEAKAAVNKLFTNESGNLDTTKVLKYVDDCSGQEKAIQDAILAAAKKAAGNKDIVIGFKDKSWVYEIPVAEVKDSENNVTTAAKSGKISFTLLLTKAQADGTRTAEIAVAEVAIDAANGAKYIDLAAMKTTVEAEIKDAAKLKTLALEKDNDGDEIKKDLEAQFTTLTSSVEGYKLEWAKKADKTPDFTYEPATQEKAAKLSFKAVLTLKGTDTSELISVEVTDVLAKDDKYQTAAELKAKIVAMQTEIVVEEAVADDTAAVAAIQAAVDEQKGTGSTLTATVFKTTDLEDAAKNSVWTPATDGTNASLTNVKIVIDAENTFTVEKFTFKVVAPSQD